MTFLARIPTIERKTEQIVSNLNEFVYEYFHIISVYSNRKALNYRIDKFEIRGFRDDCDMSRPLTVEFILSHPEPVKVRYTNFLNPHKNRNLSDASEIIGD